MFEFFDKVLGFLESFFSFISNLAESLVLTYDTITQSLFLPSYFITFLPPLLGTAIFITVFIGIIKFVIGR